MKSTDIYLCRLEVRDAFKIIRNPTFRGFSEPFKVIQPVPTYTQVREWQESRRKTNAMMRKMIADYLNFMERTK